MAIVPTNRLELALTRIAESDERCAELKGNMLRCEFLAKTAESVAFKACEGSIEDRKHQARLTPEVQSAWERYFQAVVEYEKCKARREREFTLIELYRTEQASLRRATV